METTQDYDQFLRSKVKRESAKGFTPVRMSDALFDWQKFVVDIAVRQGRMALFEGCGCGKTIQELEWSRQVVLHTSGRVLILRL